MNKGKSCNKQLSALFETRNILAEQTDKYILLRYSFAIVTKIFGVHFSYTYIFVFKILLFIGKTTIFGC